MYSRVRIFHFATLLIALISTIFLFLAYFETVPGDFNIYFNAAKAIKVGLDPYTVTNGGHGGYVYGPFLACALSLLSSFSALLGAKIWFILNLLILLLLVKFIKSLWDLSNNKNTSSSFIYSALALSFPVRNNFGQGQVMILVAFLTLLTIYICDKKPTVFYEILATFFVSIAFEMKPYLVLGLIVLLVLKRKYRILLILPIMIVFFNIIYFEISGITWLNWLRALHDRSGWVSGAPDQASIFSLLQSLFNLGATPAMLLTLCLVAISLFATKNKRALFMGSDTKWLEYACLIAPCIWSPFMHAHDNLLVVVVILSLFSNQISTSLKSEYLVLGIYLAGQVNWTNENLLIGFFVVLLYFLNVYLNINRIKFLTIATGLLFATFQTFLLQMNPASRLEIYNLGAITTGVMGFLIVMTAAKIPQDSSEMSVLSPSRDNLDWDS